MDQVIDAIVTVALLLGMAWVIIFGTTTAAYAERLGRNPVLGFVAGSAFGPLAWLGYWLSERRLGDRLGRLPDVVRRPPAPATSGPRRPSATQDADSPW